MTFDDDYIQLRLNTGPLRVPCKQLRLEWPPPERISVSCSQFSSPLFRRVSFSQITDEQRSSMTHVCRGAEYVHDDAAAGATH